MHMADALLAPAVAAPMYAASTVTAGASIVKLNSEEKLDHELAAKKLPTMAVMSALVFAGQMINYTIPGTGSSGHICGGMLLTSVLGPWAGFLSMIAVLAIQCLFFADGGRKRLGANIWNMAFYGCFVGYFLIYRPIMHSNWFSGKGEKAAGRLRIIAASVIGCIVTLQLGAFSVVVETSLSGITALPFGAFAALMQPIHLAIGLVEGLITAAVLLFDYKTRPSQLREVDATPQADAGSKRKALAVLAIAALVIGGGLSLLASSNPDGLEWALFGNQDGGYSDNLGLSEDHYGVTSQAGTKAEKIVEKTAWMPDYAFANDPENQAGTSVAGIAGAAAVAVVAGLVCLIGSLHRRKKQHSEAN